MTSSYSTTPTHVAGPDRRPVDDLVVLDDADAHRRKVKVGGRHRPRVLGRLAAEEGTAGRAAARRDPGDDRGDLLGHEPADRHVVQQEERLRAGADHVVGAHGHEVDPEAAEQARRPRQGRLRPDAVC
jgi:hypothetical protein